MRFRATHKLIAYLLVLVSFAALALGGEVSAPVVLGFLAAVAASWFHEPDPRAADRAAPWWNVAIVVVAILLAVDFVRGNALVNDIVMFVLFLTLQRLFSRRTNREYRHLVYLGFAMLMLGTLLNSGLSFAACFAVYIALLTWNLIFVHLRREMEENYLLKHSEARRSERVEVERILNSRRVVGGSFLLGTSLVSLGVFLGATSVFVLFPRVGLGFFLGPGRSGVLMAGFSERVALGQHGVIKDNPQVVMRVRLDQRPREPLRFRGAVFDRYRAGGWQHTRPLRGRPLPAGLNRLEDTGRQPLLEQDIALEPLDSQILFAADRPAAFEVPAASPAQATPRRFWVGFDGELRARRSGGVRYKVFSMLARPSPERLAAAGGAIPPIVRSRYLDLPDDLPERVRQLAARLSEGRPTVAQRVDAVLDHLGEGYRYTVDLYHDPRRDPLEEFLFDTRRGHCEYFSTAMAVLLREMGVPTRNVNGFLGGEWNALGGYLAVRHGDAHSWVEAYYPGVGWVTFDPTPPSGRLAATGSGPLAWARLVVDNLRHHWFRWVVDYNLEKQAMAARSLARVLRGKPLSPGFQGWRETVDAIIRPLLWGILGAMLLWALWRAFRRMARSPRRGRIVLRRGSAEHPALRAYRRMLALLERQGLAKQPAETPREFASRLADHPGAQLVARVTDTYYRLRFSGGPASPADLADLSADVASLRALGRSARSTGNA